MQHSCLRKKQNNQLHPRYQRNFITIKNCIYNEHHLTITKCTQKPSPDSNFKENKNSKKEHPLTL